MKKTFLSVISALFIASTVNAADISFGLSASYSKINASGTETENTEKTNASVSNETLIGSIFVENNYGNFSLGLDWIPFKADVSSKTKSRADSNSDGDTGTNKAQAEISNHITLYGLVPFGGSYYFKAGAVSVNVDSKENLASGSTYGDETVYGGLVGVGYQSGNWRVGLEYTDYQEVSLTSQTNSDNKVTADLDTTSLKVSYSF